MFAARLWGLFDDLVQFAFGVAGGHFFEGNRFDFVCLSFAAEGEVAVEADLFHGFDGFAQVFARVEFGRVFCHEAADGAGGGEAQVGVDVDFAYAVFDAFDDFFHRHAVGFADVAAVFVDDFEPFLGNGAGAVHDDVCVGQGLVDFFDAVDAQYVACGRTGEFVCAVAGADGDGECIDAGVFDEAYGVFDAGEHLVVGEFADGADAVFFACFAGFEVAQYADFAFDGYAAGVGEVDDGAGGVNVVFVGGGGFAVFKQGAVHHDGGETELDGALAHVGRCAVVLVHDDGNVWKFFDGGKDEVAQEGGAGIFARACAGLDDDRCVDLVGGFHDGAHLFEVVDVERGQTVAVFGGVVEQLAHGYECHLCLLVG